MRALEARLQEAEVLWLQGDEAEAQGEFMVAYRLYTSAHDLVTDCPAHHQAAHVRLRRVNLKIGNYGELLTDWLLHLLSPIGVFELVAYFQKSEGRIARECKRA